MRYGGVEREQLPTAKKPGSVVDLLSRVAVRRDRWHPFQGLTILDEGLCLEWHRVHDADHSRKGILRRVLRNALKLSEKP